MVKILFVQYIYIFYTFVATDIPLKIASIRRVIRRKNKNKYIINLSHSREKYNLISKKKNVNIK